jgi:hypothetical protein
MLGYFAIIHGPLPFRKRMLSAAEATLPALRAIGTARPASIGPYETCCVQEAGYSERAAVLDDEDDGFQNNEKIQP